MNQKRINALIPIAAEHLRNSGLLKEDKGKTGIESKYFSALSSFAPTVVQSGILKALAFYSVEDDTTGRKPTGLLVRDILFIDGFLAVSTSIKKSQSIFDIYLELIKEKSTLERLHIKNRILEAIIACKVAIMLFHKIKSDNK